MLSMYAPDVSVMDAVAEGYTLELDDQGTWTVYAPVEAGTREIVAEETDTYEGMLAARDHLQDMRNASWCEKCGDQAVCDECVGG